MYWISCSVEQPETSAKVSFSAMCVQVYADVIEADHVLSEENWSVPAAP